MLNTMNDTELDAITDAWLRENDDYYTDKDKWKSKRGNVYLTERQMAYRQRKEIPFSNVFKNRLKTLELNNVDITNLVETY